MIFWLFMLLCACAGSALARTPLAQSFISRPDILAPVLNVRLYEPDKVALGYIFLSNWEDDLQQRGPYLYQNDGTLVWSGHDPAIGPMGYFNFQSFRDHKNDTKAFVFRGASERGRGQGHVALFNSSYHIYKTVQAPPHLQSLDFHEFQVSDNGRTGLAVAFNSIQSDLTGYGIEDGLGWLLDSVFLNIDLETNEILFEWRASQHIDLATEPALQPSKRRAAGLSYREAYDFFHINSIDRFKNGDYLISARHTNAVYRIDAVSGNISWRLGGKLSDFEMRDVKFLAQHDARILEEDSERLLISLFDNAYNGIDKSSNSSSAMIIDVNLSRRDVHLVEQYFPSEQVHSQNQGSVQHLRPNGGYLVSWGIVAEFSEVDAKGERVLDVAFADQFTRAYRVTKSDWIGEPATKPDLHLYARNSSASTHFWMSWNGATEVVSWRVYEGHLGDHANGRSLGSTEKTGFETHFEAEKFVNEGYVEAIGVHGVLGRSEVRHVQVPSEGLHEACGESHCTRQVFVDEADWIREFDENASLDYVKSPTAEISSPASISIGPRSMQTISAVSIFAVGLLLGRTRMTGACLWRLINACVGRRGRREVRLLSPS